MNNSQNKGSMNKEKDLALNPFGNTILFGIGIFMVIIGSKGVAYELGWKSYVIAIGGSIMLYLQNNFLFKKVREEK